ncbi:MAG: hypothetical protein KF897_09140 [Opitutaceae bacterium]|nr:hypothetical protein [Opitutaceae bacterium]
MNVRLKFVALLGLMLLAFAGALWGLREMARRAAVQDAAQLHRAREQQLDHWLKATGRSLRDFAREGAGLAAQRLLREDASIPPAAEVPGITAYWIVRRGGTVARVAADYGLVQPPIPAAKIALWTAEPPPYRFFSESDAGLLELCVEPVVLDPGAPPWGWLLAARRWDDAHLKVLSSLTEGRVTLDLHPAATPASEHVHTRLLPDWQGRPLRSLQVSYAAPGSEPGPGPIGADAAMFFGFGLLLIAGLALSLHCWVLQPLGRIGASLAAGQPEPLAPLLRGRDEFAATARMLEAFFAQRDALKREIEERRRVAAALAAAEADLRRTLEERTRLGRDLHDGVIQALYATGMGLAGIRALLRPGDTEAAERLNQCRATLNEIIRDVRNFITGLEPEALRQQTFTQAVHALLEFMQSISPARTEAAIDEDLAAQLTLNQRANALHIMREAVSNALRHGAAEQIRVTLARTPEGQAALDIADDGVGFNPEAGATTRGRGLENLAQRATELGATFTLHSEPGAGTRLRFVFTLSPSP